MAAAWLSGGGGGGAGLGGAVYDDGGSFTAEGVTFTNDVARGGNGGEPASATAAAAAAAAASAARATAPAGLVGSTAVVTAAAAAAALAAAAAGGLVATAAPAAPAASAAAAVAAAASAAAVVATAASAAAPVAAEPSAATAAAAAAEPASAAASSATAARSLSSTTRSPATPRQEGPAGTARPRHRPAAPGSGYGGAVFAVNGTVNATFVTFSSNTAEDGNGNALDGTDVYVLTDLTDTGVHGGGTFNGTFVDDILGQSSATTSDFVANSINGGTAPTLTAQYDLISNNNPSIGTGLPTSGPGMLIGDDPMLGALVSNGGPTPTMALMPTSPAIAAGITADYPGTNTPITTDQRGYSPRDHARHRGLRVHPSHPDGHGPEPDQRPGVRRHFGDDHRHRLHRRHGGRLRHHPGDQRHHRQRHHDHRRQSGGHRHRGRDRDHGRRDVALDARRSFHLHLINDRNRRNLSRG